MCRPAWIQRFTLGWHGIPAKKLVLSKRWGWNGSRLDQLVGNFFRVNGSNHQTLIVFSFIQRFPDSFRQISFGERLLNEVYPLFQHAVMGDDIGRIS